MYVKPCEKRQGGRREERGKRVRWRGRKWKREESEMEGEERRGKRVRWRGKMEESEMEGEEGRE